MLSENKTTNEGICFCSEARNYEWRKEIQDQLSSGTIGPKTIVGVLGSTGVGKSSLLNALLDEAAVLPTSGSRGCTAAVVELTYNRDLVQDAAQTASAASVIVSNVAKKIPVYKGKVEFIKMED
jgi:ATPase subunit of ABC transporter with duplicated ATPase domains